MNSNKKQDSVTLKSATAYQLLSQRENICELFNVVDRSEIDEYIMNNERKKEILDDMKLKLENIKKASD